MKCTLDREVNQCPHLTDEGFCNNENPCSFQEKTEIEIKRKPVIPRKPYVREERWYEKYYK